jgi:tetratricopeptide (TPR) repeat protein
LDRHALVSGRPGRHPPGRRGTRRFAPRRLWLGLALGGLLWLAGACAGTKPPPCLFPEEVAYAGGLDSLGIDAYRRRPSVEQEARRQAAATWRARAGRAQRAAIRLQALRTAVGLAPDHAQTWLELARLSRWLGDRESAMRALDAAEAALDELPRQERARLRMRIAQQEAWLHRDRGEWDAGLAMAETAAVVSPLERETVLLRGLLAGQRGGGPSPAMLVARDIQRFGNVPSDAVWVYGLAALGEGMLPEAYHYLTAGPDELHGLHKADYYNDLGLVCERLDNWFDAERFYVKAAHALPVRDRGCLQRLDLPLRAGDGRPVTLPVWLSFDRYFVAGSLHAYAREAVARFEAATSAGPRAYWSDAAIGALSVCVRKGAAPTDSRALRGRVYMQIEAWGLAEADLTAALAEQRAAGRPDPATLYWLGKLKVEEERYAAAASYLEESVRAQADLADGWNLLGYARLQLGDRDGARAALDRTLELDPERPAAWYNRGLLHFNTGNWEPAVLDLQRAAELAPDNAEIGAVLRRAVLQLQAVRRGLQPGG